MVYFIVLGMSSATAIFLLCISFQQKEMWQLNLLNNSEINKVI